MYNYDQAEGLRRMRPVKPIRVIAVTSGKGGVGKTNLTINLATAMSKSGCRTAILDADMGLANVDILLGLFPEYNLSHVMSGEKSLKDVIVTMPSGLKVIPSSSGVQSMSHLSNRDQASLISLFSQIDNDIDAMIVDTAAGIAPSTVNLVRACHDIVVVICDEPTSLTDAYAYMKLLNRDYGLQRFHVVSNMVKSPEHGQALFNKLRKVTDYYLDVALNYEGAIPQDDFLKKSVQQQKPVMDAFPQSRAAIAIKNIARRIEHWPMQSHNTGYLEFFVERMIKYSG